MEALKFAFEDAKKNFSFTLDILNLTHSNDLYQYGRYNILGRSRCNSTWSVVLILQTRPPKLYQHKRDGQ